MGYEEKSDGGQNSFPWLIKKFVDKEAQFIFGLNGQTASFWQPPIQCLPNNN